MRCRFLPNFASFPVVLLVIAALVQSGCGYRPLHAVGHSLRDEDSGTLRYAAPTRLAVMAIRNDSPEPWLDRILTDALRREMDARGSIRLVNDPRDAELILQGSVRPLIVQSRSFSSFVAALEYSVTLSLALEIVRTGGEVLPLDQSMLTETEVYLASADVETTRTHKKEALRRLSDILASRIADSIELLEGSDRGDASGDAADNHANEAANEEGA